MTKLRVSLTIALVAVTAAVLVLYTQKLGNQFVFDDYAFVIKANDQADIQNIPEFFKTDQHRLYRPLRSVAYTLVRHWYGLSPMAHQAAGLLFHLLVTLAFTLIVYQLCGSARMAMIAGLVAGLHPVHCDRAVPVTGSFDLLGLALGYSGLAAFLSWIKSKKRLALLTGSLLLLLGLLASEEVATVPLLMALFWLAAFEVKEKRTRFAVAAAFSFALLGFYLLVRSVYVPDVARVKEYAAGGLFETILTMSVVFWRYIGYALFPFGLAPEHDVTIFKTLSPTPLLCLAGLALIAAIAFLERKKRPCVFIAIGWFFIGLAPFSNLLPLDTLLAERYFYSGLFGFALILAYGIDWLIKNTIDANRVIAVSCTVIILILYFIISSMRIQIWHDDESLWRDAVKKEPRSYLANLNYGNKLYESGNADDAMVFWQTAAKVKPTGFEVYVAFGNVFMAKGEPEKAKEQYLTSLKNQPGHIPALEGLQQAELALGNTEKAFRIANDLLKDDPNNLVSLNVVSYILARSGHCDKAIPLLERLIHLSDKEALLSAARKNLEFCKTQQTETTE